MSRHVACCDDHKALGCCDPVDCAPCCRSCQSCPTLGALTAEDRAQHALIVDMLAAHGMAVSVRIHSAVRTLPNLGDLSGLDAHLAGLRLATAEAVEVTQPLWLPMSGQLTA